MGWNREDDRDQGPADYVDTHAMINAETALGGKSKQIIVHAIVGADLRKQGLVDIFKGDAESIDLLCGVPLICDTSLKNPAAHFGSEFVAKFVAEVLNDQKQLEQKTLL